VKPGHKSVAISVSLAADIDTLVGRENRNAFAAEMVRRELERIKEQRARHGQSQEQGV
jgi:hypothetical protein